MHASIRRRACALVAALTCAQQVQAQVFVNSPASVPSGTNRSEQVDLADIDLDGDWDAGFAHGGDGGNDQNRLWVNQGGLQGGTIGFFVDVTAAQAPAIQDQSRDIEFVDFDGDGDPDVHVSNTSQISNQPCRWWTNLGGLQAGSAGFYVDETAQRWVGIGGAGSSISNGQVLGAGGYITFAQDHDFADLDADGDLDLIASAVGGSFGGQEPTRLFLNDGLGFFSEFNPSGFKLTGQLILNGNPALWCEGLQQGNTSDTTGAFADIAAAAFEVSLGDVDGDLDMDVLVSELYYQPRMFRNRLVETGTLAFRDVTGSTWPQAFGTGGKYEQDFADLDGDDDVDLYGLGWSASNTTLSLRGAGDGTFVEPTILAHDPWGDSSADVVDYDGDGDLDLYVAPFTGDDRLHANVTAGGPLAFAQVSDPISGLPPGVVAYDLDTADVDADGDFDVMRAGFPSDLLLLNVLGVPDTTAPRLAHLEQPADHASGQATPIRVQHYDNAPDYLVVSSANELLHSVDGGPFVSTPMGWSGGQVLRGELPASAVGNVRYFVRSTDEHGNVGESGLKAIDTSGGCSGQPATYCTPKLNSDGCLPRIEFEGAPEVGGPTSFLIRGTDVLSNANGLLIYSKTGPDNVPFNGGVLCVGAGLLRTPGQNSGGAGACGGTLTFDFNAWAGLGSDPGLVAGQPVWAQYWYRDVASPGGNGLTNGVTFVLCP